MTAVRAALSETAVRRPASDQSSIAVPRFANLSADPESEYFGDGLAEEIINLLVQTPGLKVIARRRRLHSRKQEDIRRDRRDPRCRPSSKGAFAGRQSHSGNRAAHLGSRRQPSMVKALRPRACGRVCDSG